MSQFGSDVTQAPEIQTYDTPQEGVAKSYAGLGAASDLFDMAAGIMGDRKKKKNESFVGEFTRQQLLLAESYEQGNRSLTATRTRMRKNLLDAIEANPAMAPELMKAQQALLGIEGGGNVVREGTEQDQRKKAMDDKLVADGWVSYNASPEEFDQAARDRNMYEQALLKYKAQTDTIDLEMKKIGLSGARRTELEAQRTQLHRDTVRDTMPGAYRERATSLDSILNNSEMSAGDKIKAIENEFLAWEQGVNNLFAGIPADEAKAYKEPFLKQKDLYIATVKGEFETTALKAETDKNLAAATNMMAQDPVLLSHIAASKAGLDMGVFAKARSGSVYKKITDIGSALLAPNETDTPNLNPYTNDKDSMEATKIVVEDLTKSLESNDPERVQAATEALNEFFLKLDTNEGNIRYRPQDGKEIVRFLASDEMYNLISKNKTALTNIGGAAEVIGRHYTDEVMGLVRREFTDNKIVDMSKVQVEDVGKPKPLVGEGARKSTVPADVTTNAPDAVAVQSTTAGVNFVAIDTTNKDAVAKAKELNKTLKPVINQVVRATAHLEGHQNYKSVWDSLSVNVFSGGGKDELAGGDAGDDLSMSDFAEKLEAMPADGEPVGNVIEAGKGYTIVRREDGTVEKRSGSRNWRNNNPGNIEYGKFAKSHGAIGSDGRFAVFPTYEAGRQAKRNLLFNTSGYKNKTIYGAISRYAPDFENDTNAYANAVARALGVSTDTPLSSLTEVQIETMLDAMERVEGFKIGRVEVVG